MLDLLGFFMIFLFFLVLNGHSTVSVCTNFKPNWNKLIINDSNNNNNDINGYTSIKIINTEKLKLIGMNIDSKCMGFK